MAGKIAGLHFPRRYMPTLYRQRREAKTLFAALKSLGFNLEATHLTASDQSARTPKPEPFPLRTRSAQGILTTLERQQTEFEACLQALRTPSRLLSGT